MLLNGKAYCNPKILRQISLHVNQDSVLHLKSFSFEKLRFLKISKTSSFTIVLLYGRFHSYISGFTMTVSIRDAVSGMEISPPLGYFRSYIGKSVGS